MKRIIIKFCIFLIVFGVLIYTINKINKYIQIRKMEKDVISILNFSDVFNELSETDKESLIIASKEIETEFDISNIISKIIDNIEIGIKNKYLVGDNSNVDDDMQHKRYISIDNDLQYIRYKDLNRDIFKYVVNYVSVNDINNCKIDTFKQKITSEIEKSLTHKGTNYDSGWVHHLPPASVPLPERRLRRICGNGVFLPHLCLRRDA